LLQTHDHDDTLTFNICPATTAGALDKILQLYLDNIKQPFYTDTTREREQLGFKINIYTFLNMYNLGDTLLP